jgi:predicted acyl esterase
MNKPRHAISHLAVLILLVVAWSSEANSQVRVPFTRTEAMITMRDGVRLHTVILTPQTQTEPLPILIDRTPYGVNEWNSDLVKNAYKDLLPTVTSSSFRISAESLIPKGSL